MKNFFFLLLSLFLITNSYSQTRLSIDEDFEKYGYDHETLALIPLNVKISLRPKQMKSLSKDDLEQMQENESYSFQQAFYSWCLKREDQDKL